MKILVCGGREFTDYQRLSEAMSSYVIDSDAVCSGGARGADLLARRWCFDNGIAFFECPAQWDYFKRGAGHVRNGWMLKWWQPDLVMAFPGGKGTEGMVNMAKQEHIEVVKL